MKAKTQTLLVLIVLLHAIPACDLFMRCGDPEAIVAPTAGVMVEVYSDNREDGYDMDAPFDRRFLYINVQQQPDDSLLWYVRYLSNVGSLMNSAIAFQCEDDYVVLPEHIADLDVLSLWDQDGFSKGDSLTHLFVTTNGGSGLYQSIEHSLARQVQTLTLACKEVPQGDSLGWVIRTQLSDDRVFLDTLTFSLQ